MKNTGTWIDWQYLLDAATLLKKVQNHPSPFFLNLVHFTTIDKQVLQLILISLVDTDVSARDVQVA